jgi:hypothetical protein
MKRIYLIIFGLLFCLSCNSQTEISEESNIVFNASEAKQVESEYQKVKQLVDNIYNSEESKIELYIQENIESKIERVPNFDNIPESILRSFNIVRGSDNEVIMIAEYPFSDSGDWDITYESYFDKKGNLIAFVRLSNFFNGQCAEIVKERSIYYYDKKHILVKKTYEIKDGEEKLLNFADCIFNYRYDYTIFVTLLKYFENNKFEN